MPIIHGPIGFRAGGGGDVTYTVLGTPPTVDVVSNTVEVAVVTAPVVVDILPDEIEVTVP